MAIKETLRVYVPRSAQDWLVLSVLLCLAIGVIAWSWEELKLAIVHWQITLGVVSVICIMAFRQYGQMVTLRTGILKTLKASQEGLTLEELASQLGQSRVDLVERQVELLLTEQELRWTQNEQGTRVLTL